MQQSSGAEEIMGPKRRKAGGRKAAAKGNLQVNIATTDIDVEPTGNLKLCFIVYKNKLNWSISVYDLSWLGSLQKYGYPKKCWKGYTKEEMEICFGERP